MRTYIYLSLLVMALGFVACQKKDDSSGNGTYAGTPVQSCNVPGNTSCNPGHYNQVGGPQLQNYQWSYAGGFCGCQTGLRPVMNSQWGISCAPSNWFPSSAYYGFDYNTVAYQSQNTQWMAIPQVTYAPAVTGNGTNCYTKAASVCDIRNANSCNDGGICRQTAGGTYMGFCVYGSGQETYSTQICQWEYSWSTGWAYRCRDNYYNNNQTNNGNGR